MNINMLTKENLIKAATEAKRIGGNVYLIKEDNQIKLEIFKGYSKDYPKYNKLITGMTPTSILKDNWCVFEGWETTIDKMIENINSKKVV